MISEFPLYIFTTLTGLAAGALVAAAVFPRKAQTDKPWLFSLVMLLLTGIGSLASVAHLGRPRLMMYMLGNPTSSLMLEGIFAGLVCLVLIASSVLAATKKAENRALIIVAAVFGIVLMAVQAYAYSTSFGNAAWRGFGAWPFFILGSVGTGFALWSLFNKELDAKFGMVTAAMLVLAALSFVLESVMFAAVGAQIALLILGAVAAFVAAACAYVGSIGKLSSGMAIAIALGVTALVIARYGFYMASII